MKETNKDTTDKTRERLHKLIFEEGAPNTTEGIRALADAILREFPDLQTQYEKYMADLREASQQGRTDLAAELKAEVEAHVADWYLNPQARQLLKEVLALIDKHEKGESDE